MPQQPRRELAGLLLWAFAWHGRGAGPARCRLVCGYLLFVLPQGAFSRVSGVPFLRKLELYVFDSTLGDTIGATLDFDPVAEFGNPFLRIGANRCQFIAQFVGSKLGYRPGIAFTCKLLGKCSRRALWLAPLSCRGFC